MDQVLSVLDNGFAALLDVPGFNYRTHLYTEAYNRLPQNIVVDCSHGNSGKKPERQAVVMRDVLSQIEAGNESIRGFMLESNLEGGNQPMLSNPALLNPRQSVTDSCIDWPTTEALLREAHVRMSKLMRKNPESRIQKSE